MLFASKRSVTELVIYALKLSMMINAGVSSSKAPRVDLAYGTMISFTYSIMVFSLDQYLGE